MRNRPMIYDECGDIRLLTEKEREALLRAWEKARPKLDKNLDFDKFVVYGTD